MPSLPDIPGKSLVEGTTKRVRVLVGVATAGAFAAGGVVLKRVLGHGDDGRPDADPIAETPTAPPGAEEKPVPKPKPAKPKPKAAKPKPAKPPKPKAEKPAKPKPAKKAAPPKPKGTNPKAEPGNISTDREHPHRALNNPVEDPDETEYPDPFEKRPDPRDPVDPDGEPFGEEPHPATGSESTSEPPPSQDPVVERGGKPPQRDNLDN